MSKKKVKCDLGMLFPEDSARKIDALLRKGCSFKRTKSESSSVEVNKKERSEVSVISTDMLDRDNEVVLPEALDTSVYLTNPLVLFDHRWEELPVGRCAWLKQFENGWKAKSIYAHDDDFIDRVWNLVSNDFLPGKSIGMIRSEVRQPTAEEIAARPELVNCKGVISKCVLVEYSVVSVPACPEALVESVAKGLTDPRSLEIFGIKPVKQRLSPKQHVEQVKKSLFQLKLDPEKIAERILNKMRKTS